MNSLKIKKVLTNCGLPKAKIKESTALNLNQINCEFQSS